jgi:hypothetical protein
VEEEEPEAAMSFVGVVIGLGEEGNAVATDGEVRAWRSGVAAAVLPVTSCDPRFDRVLSGGEYGSGEPHTESRRAPPLYIAQGDGGSPAMDGLGTPDQSADQRPNRLIQHLLLPRFDWTRAHSKEIIGHENTPTTTSSPMCLPSSW